MNFSVSVSVRKFAKQTSAAISFVFLSLGAAQADLKKPSFESTAQSPIAFLKSKSSVHVLVLGDSMSAGALADTTLGAKLTGKQISRLLAIKTLHHHHTPGSEDYEDELRRLSVSANASAFDSNLPGSLRSRMRDIASSRGIPFSLVNQSRLGATSDRYGAQIMAYRGRYAKGDPVANLVVVNIGGNDWCQNVSETEYLQNMEFRLYQILKDHPKALVVVNSVPNMVDTFAVRDTVAFRIGNKPHMCESLEPLIEEECPTGIRLRKSFDVNGESEVDDVLESQVSSMTNGLKRLVTKLALGGGSYSAFSGRLEWLDLSKQPVEKTDLAADCFHPGAEGHKKWAKLFWQFMFWGQD